MVSAHGVVLGCGMARLALALLAFLEVMRSLFLVPQRSFCEENRSWARALAHSYPNAALAALELPCSLACLAAVLVAAPGAFSRLRGVPRFSLKGAAVALQSLALALSVAHMALSVAFCAALHGAAGRSLATACDGSSSSGEDPERYEGVVDTLSVPLVEVVCVLAAVSILCFIGVPRPNWQYTALTERSSPRHMN
eukprot:m51a1_g3998 hypothetical protein (196) ;mRNA; r:516080-516667